MLPKHADTKSLHSPDVKHVTVFVVCPSMKRVSPTQLKVVTASTRMSLDVDVVFPKLISSGHVVTEKNIKLYNVIFQKLGRVTEYSLTRQAVRILSNNVTQVVDHWTANDPHKTSDSECLLYVD